MEEIETAIRRENNSEVPVERVGEFVMDKLLALDQVAYVRFASVYQQFDDVKLFAQLLECMNRRNRTKNSETISQKTNTSSNPNTGELD